MMQFEQKTERAKMKNPKVKATIKPAGTDFLPTEQQEREKRVDTGIRRRENYSLPCDKIANDKFAVRNHPIPKGKELFPLEWKMHFVDLCYPYAEGGPLYIDMPSNLHDIALCERKLEALRKSGLRYTYLKAGEGVWEAEMRLQGQDPESIKRDQQALRAQEARP